MSQVLLLLLLLERHLRAQGQTGLVAEMLKKSRCGTCRREDEEVLLEPRQGEDVSGSQRLPLQWGQRHGEEPARGKLWSALVLRAGACRASSRRAGGQQSWAELGATLAGAGGSPASHPPRHWMAAG